MMDICRASASDIAMMLEWAAEEGWNPGLDDAQVFQAADPDGFFVGLVDGQPVASVSVVNHSDAFAFLGLYIVRPEFRGKGHGKALWDAAIAHAKGRIIGLDGVPEQQENYRRSGFSWAGKTARYSGVAEGRVSSMVRVARPDDFAALIAQEAQKSGVAKPAYLANWYAASSTRQTFVLDDAAGIQAHATLRHCHEGHKIGPLCANTKDAAETLLDHCLATAKGPLSIDVPHSAPSLAELCNARGLAVSFETARMYRGPAPGRPEDLAAVTTLELG